MSTLTAVLHKYKLTGAVALSGDALVLAIGRAIDRGLLLALFVLMGRVLGVAEYGQFSYAFALASLIGVLSELGLSVLVNREVARAPEITRQYVDNGSGIRMVVGSLTTILTGLILWLLHTPATTIAMVLLLLLSMVIEAFQSLLFAVFRAQRRMAYQTKVIIVTRATTVVLGLLALYNLQTGVAVAAMFPLGSVVGSVFALYLYRHHFAQWRPAFDGSFWLHLVRSSLPFAVAIVFGMIHFRVDTVILQWYRGEIEVGLYNAAYTVVVGAAILATAFMNALFPVMARLYVTAVEKLRTVFWAGLGVMALFGLFVAIIGTVFAEPILQVLYGDEYRSAAQVMQLLSWGVCFSFLNNMTGSTLNAIDLQVPNMWTIGSGALANIALNLLLIPYWGNVGAAITTMTSELLVFILGLIQVMWFFHNRRKRVT